MELFPAIYEKLIDPFLSGVRQLNYHYIPEGSDVIDIACGTGAQARLLARKCNRVEGIDISESMIIYAEKRKNKLGITNLYFSVRDAADLRHYPDNTFNSSVLTMALHQFPQDSIRQILLEASRISREIIITDYAVPQRGNFYGFFVNLIEQMAGKQHYQYFRNYVAAGGMVSLCRDAGLRMKSSKTFGRGMFEQCRYERS